ncbi:hypothetical protein SpiGrapes_2718 [Sphaerochaeta pleomorpha str. Grapes]|uniref:Uncharacterized protein n=1 Tax=Sphaerochaeta pleomorpha (strain ATCC BAA-1885 / DSM 22778 / Grapes) TaxID=158190 RepID=G8QVV1_SPHPG|nr:hypothetical protein [Sphaerochaeta pleomorpha]AEV30475.1 hypothetical protein SpiGrapes_2718 [Sphaerochaeta pleomorpha str. Grapes]
MKHRIYEGLLVLACCLLLVSVFSGCNDNPRCKALVIINESDNAIEDVGIRQYVSKPKLDEPFSGDEVTIAAGASKTFYLAPYSADSVILSFYDGVEVSEGGIEFTYEYLVNGKNETITALYTGTEITLSGSNAKKVGHFI